METGKSRLLQQMSIDNVEYIFGNPGTVEQGILDELDNYPQIKYITCLQESIAVAMADGYARAAGRPAVVQLHSGVGLGNGIGMLYQAYRGHTPLIVFAGEAGIRYEAMDAQMACDLVKMAEPVTKYAVRVTHQDSVLRLWRRAYKMAVTPPMGPVFFSLPMDILDMENHEEICKTPEINFSCFPPRKEMLVIAEALSEAKNPVILAGDGVSACDAEKELGRLAELAGIPVYGVNSSCINISQMSPWYRGDLGHMFGTVSREAVKEADFVLVLGTYLFPEVFPELDSPFQKDARIYHIDLNAYEIAKNHPLTLGICANIKEALLILSEILEACALPYRQKRVDLLEQKKTIQPPYHPVMTEFMGTLRKITDESMVLFDEALTASSYLSYYLPRTRAGTFFQTRGGSLGVGIPGGMGILLANPQKQVIVFTGDGGSMYTIQALYTANRYGIPVKIVICNNGKYRLLEQNLEVYRKEHEIDKKEQPDCFSLNPEVDFAGLALSMGVKGIRAETQEQAREAAERLVCARESFLVDLIMK